MSARHLCRFSRKLFTSVVVATLLMFVSTSVYSEPLHGRPHMGIEISINIRTNTNTNINVVGMITMMIGMQMILGFLRVVVNTKKLER